MAVSAAAILILCLALGRGTGGPLNSRVAVFLGEASYSIYMVHGLLVLAYMQLIERHLVPAEASLTAGVLTAASGVAIVIALGILVHLCVEVPARSALRALADRLLNRDARLLPSSK